MRISQHGIVPKREAVRSAKPATVPLDLFPVCDLGGVPEGHSLDGRMWSIITPAGARKVLLLEEDTGVILDEIAVRVTWYTTRDYLFWARGVDWLMFSNEIITHDGTTLTSQRLMYEYPLDEYRYTTTEGDAIAGRTTIFDQFIMGFDWVNTPTNPFPWRADNFAVPPCLRFQRTASGKLFLGRWLMNLGDGEPIPGPVAPRSYMVAGEVMSYRYPQVSGDLMVHENSFQVQECELSILSGKLYGSAFRWLGRAYLFPRDFNANGDCYSTMYLLVTNSTGINASGDMETTIGTEIGKGVIPIDGIAFRRGEESITSGPWRTSDGADVVFGNNEIALEDGVISSAVGGGTLHVSDDSISEVETSGEYLKFSMKGAAKYWMHPAGTGGGKLAGLAVGTSRDTNVYTDMAKFNRFTAPVNHGGATLPRQVDKYAVLDSYCAAGTKLHRSRIVREGTVTHDLTPDWTEIIKTPVKISLVESETGTQWDMADGPLLFKSYRNGTTLGYYDYLPSAPRDIPLKWITATGAIIDDTYTMPSIGANQFIRFPYCTGGAVYAVLYQDGSPYASSELTIPEACAGMWTRPFASWDYKVSESVGIHCNFQYTQGMNFIHAPATTIKDGSLVGGRMGILTFYHATTGNIFHLLDEAFVPMVEDMEVNTPTTEDPSPALYIPNGGNWLKEYGSDPFTDAFGKTRYRQNVAVITNWSGQNVDGYANKQWTAHRLAVVKMELDTDELDLAAVAMNCKVNRT